MALDLNRGLVMRPHPKGLKVAMYFDDPGTYYDAKGTKLDEKFAEQAGFDLEKNRREKLKLEKLAAFKAQLDSEYSSAEERLAAEMSRNGGHDIRHVGADQFAVYGTDGNRVMVGTRAEVEQMFGPISVPGLGEAA